LDSTNLHDNVAYCIQNVQMFHGTLGDNISLYDRCYSEDAISEAAGKLNLIEWLNKFPDGINTNLEMSENNLSAGEAQPVTLIRLTLKNPELVLRDEITSRLDAATERCTAIAVEALLNGSVSTGTAVMIIVVAGMMTKGAFGIGDSSIFVASLGTLAN
jgi:ATP-binding cassette subfamily B protein